MVGDRARRLALLVELPPRNAAAVHVMKTGETLMTREKILNEARFWAQKEMLLTASLVACCGVEP